MSFELYVFRGDIDDDEERWEPLDLARAREVITMLPGIELDADHEAYWPLRVHSVQFFLGTERSVAAPISSGGRTSRTEIRDDWRQILTALFELAERLDAEVGDTGIGRVLDRGALEQELDRYAGREDEPPPRPEPLHEPPGWPYPGYAAMSKDERQQYLARLLSGKRLGSHGFGLQPRQGMGPSSTSRRRASVRCGRGCSKSARPSTRCSRTVQRRRPGPMNWRATSLSRRSGCSTA